MTTLKEAAEKYIADKPFTLAGFSRAEVGLIQQAYQDAYEAGAAWAFDRAAEIAEAVCGDEQAWVDKYTAQGALSSTYYQSRGGVIAATDIAQAIRAEAICAEAGQSGNV